MAHEYNIDPNAETLAQKSKDREKLKELGLDNPDDKKELFFDFSDEFLQHVLGAMMTDPFFLTHASSLIRPSYFREKTQQFICKAIQAHFAKYGDQRSKASSIFSAFLAFVSSAPTMPSTLLVEKSRGFPCQRERTSSDSFRALVWGLPRPHDDRCGNRNALGR